jgi:uncharacterized membrane protein
MASFTQAVSFSGPLPPPEVLAKYSDIIPNGAERIMAMAERQSTHRETLETKVIDSNIKNQARGTLFAFILCLVTMLGGLGLIALGKDIGGLGTIITALVSLAGLFIYGRIEQRKERIEKEKALASHQIR